PDRPHAGREGRGRRQPRRDAREPRVRRVRREPAGPPHGGSTAVSGPERKDKDMSTDTDMKRWGIVMMLVGIAIFAVNAVVWRVPVLNFVGAALILFPVVLYLIRVLEGSWKGGRTR